MQEITDDVKEISSLIQSLKVTSSQQLVKDTVGVKLSDLLLKVVNKSIEKDREIEVLRQGIVQKMTNEELLQELGRRMSGPAVG